MAKKSYQQEVLERAILKDRIVRQQTYKKTSEEEKEKLRRIVSQESHTPQWTETTLGQCTAPTRFEIIGSPEIRGVVLGATFGSVRVLLDSGNIDTTLSPGTPVFTGTPKVPPRPRKQRESKADKPAEGPIAKRPKLLGYGSCRLIKWLGLRGWGFNKVKLLFELFEVPISETSISMVLGCLDDPEAYGGPAEVTPDHAAEIDRAVE